MFHLLLSAFHLSVPNKRLSLPLMKEHAVQAMVFSYAHLLYKACQAGHGEHVRNTEVDGRRQPLLSHSSSPAAIQAGDQVL